MPDPVTLALAVKRAKTYTDANISSQKGAAGGIAALDSDGYVTAIRGAVNGRALGVYGGAEFGIGPERSAEQNTAGFYAAFETIKAAGGGTLVLPSGEILITKGTAYHGGKYALLMYSNTRLLGQGIGNTIIKIADDCPADTPAIEIDHSTVELNVELAHFTLDGNRSRPTAGGEDEGISLYDFDASTPCLNAYLHDLHIHSTGMDAIDNDGTSNLLIERVRVNDCWGLASHNQVHGTVTILDCDFENNAHGRYASELPYGAAVDFHGSRLIVRNTRLNGNALGIHLRSVDTYALLDNCRIGGSGSHAVLVDDLDTMRDVMLANCEVSTTSSDPAILVKAGRVQIAGGVYTAYNGSVDMVQLEGACEHLEVTPGTMFFYRTGSGQTALRVTSAAVGAPIRFSGAVKGFYNGILAAAPVQVLGADIDAGWQALRVEGTAGGSCVLNSRLKAPRAIFQGTASAGSRIVNSVLTGDVTLPDTTNTYRNNEVNGTWVDSGLPA